MRPDWQSLFDDPASRKLCNCRGCNKPLLGESHKPQIAEMVGLGLSAKLRDLPPVVAGRINSVPYCSRCLTTPNIPGYGVGLTPRQAEKIGARSG